ncbi:hypothetical protein [uncultured Helicobacter sp.]|uniref:hypothetical protein n=1 Tax=uncultured Helicobacter sp. TaxID=175537 RepID=UPI00374E9517
MVFSLWYEMFIKQNPQNLFKAKLPKIMKFLCKFCYNAGHFDTRGMKWTIKTH